MLANRVKILKDLQDVAKAECMQEISEIADAMILRLKEQK